MKVYIGFDLQSMLLAPRPIVVRQVSVEEVKQIVADGVESRILQKDAPFLAELEVQHRIVLPTSSPRIKYLKKQDQYLEIRLVSRGHNTTFVFYLNTVS